MTTIATVLAVVVIALLGVVVFVSFAIYMRLIEHIADNEKKGVPRMENPPPPPTNKMPVYPNPPPAPPCRADWSLPKGIREREQQRLNKL